MVHKAAHTEKIVTLSGIRFCILCATSDEPKENPVVKHEAKFCPSCGMQLPIVEHDICEWCEEPIQ